MSSYSIRQVKMFRKKRVVWLLYCFNYGFVIETLVWSWSKNHNRKLICLFCHLLTLFYLFHLRWTFTVLVKFCSRCLLAIVRTQALARFQKYRVASWEILFYSAQITILMDAQQWMWYWQPWTNSNRILIITKLGYKLFLRFNAILSFWHRCNSKNSEGAWGLSDQRNYWLLVNLHCHNVC